MRLIWKKKKLLWNWENAVCFDIQRSTVLCQVIAIIIIIIIIYYNTSIISVLNLLFVYSLCIQHCT